MKQKDIIIIAVIAILAGAGSLVFSNLVISSPKNRQDKVEIVEAMSSIFKQPDPRYFNAESVNPTKIIRISDSTNPKPFNGTN